MRGHEVLDLGQELIDRIVLEIRTQDVVQDPSFILRVRSLGRSDVDKQCHARRIRLTRDDEPARLVNQVQLIGDEQLPTTPDPIVKVHCLISNNKDLVRLFQCQCERGVARIVTSAHLKCNYIRVCALNEGQCTDPQGRLHPPMSERSIHRRHEFVKVFGPRVADEDLDKLGFRAVDDLRVGLAVPIAHRLQNAPVDIIHGCCRIVLAQLCLCKVAKVVQLLQFDRTPCWVAAAIHIFRTSTAGLKALSGYWSSHVPQPSCPSTNGQQYDTNTPKCYCQHRPDTDANNIPACHVGVLLVLVLGSRARHGAGCAGHILETSGATTWVRDGGVVVAHCQLLDISAKHVATMEHHIRLPESVAARHIRGLVLLLRRVRTAVLWRPLPTIDRVAPSPRTLIKKKTQLVDPLSDNDLVMLRAGVNHDLNSTHVLWLRAKRKFDATLCIRVTRDTGRIDPMHVVAWAPVLAAETLESLCGCNPTCYYEGQGAREVETTNVPCNPSRAATTKVDHDAPSKS
mmetsp:Transcript_21733/g.70285  ORF Transcript_21733/g.70285 Transcript_21733/m.70285 type:complete len:514 (-) Transcript_21733:38-1579(-)